MQQGPEPAKVAPVEDKHDDADNPLDLQPCSEGGVDLAIFSALPLAGILTSTSLPLEGVALTLCLPDSGVNT